MFISEAVVTGLVGGVTGALFGVFLAQVVGNYINLPPEPSVSLIVFVVGFAVATSVISGLYPAWRASNLHPVEALRYE
jgi:putative ABC transport system permease protein